MADTEGLRDRPNGGDAAEAPGPGAERRIAIPSWLSPSRIGGLYVLILVIAVFLVWIPDTFGSITTVKQVLNQNATYGLVALALVVPLATGMYDLSVAATLGLTSMVSAEVVAKTGLPLAEVIVLVLLCALIIGLANAFVTVILRVDSFIGTLATSSLISATIVMISDAKQVSSLKLIGPIQTFATTQVLGLQIVVFYFLGLAVILWFVMEGTGLGRRLYAVGFNADTARLTGVRVNLLRGGSLIVSALVGGFVGIVVTGQNGTGDPSVGPPYLLPSFAIAFVGATQITPGRFNARGTVLATILIGTGSVGLALAGVPQWAPQVYLGVVLIIAVSITGIERRSGIRRKKREANPGSSTSQSTA
jgi:ribose transport system permease protein